MEYEQQNPDDGFMNRVKESPRTVSAVIIVLIVAAAIYAFSGNNQEQPANQEGTVTPTEDTDQSSEESTQPETTATPTQSPQEPSAAPTSSATPAPKVMPEARTTDSAYVEVAQKGDGLTHLARRATTRYLADRETGYTVTKEHRIYIEDYIKDNLKRHPMTIGMEETISFDLIKEAVESASKLSEQQLKNLTKYTRVLN